MMRKSKSMAFAALLLVALALTGCSRPEAPAGGVLSGVMPEASASGPAQPLVNHASYRSVADVDMGVEDLYIAVYPTWDEDSGAVITRKAFELHESQNKDYNPTLNAHIWQGDPEDPSDRRDRFGFDGSEYNCTIRVRGNYSRGAPVKSFKVKLTQKGGKLFSVDSLNLNKHCYDDTRTNNKMCADLLQMIETDMVGYETKFLRLFINDIGEDGSETGFVDQGLYVWIEQPNRDFLTKHGLDPDGALYKPDIFEFTLNDALRPEEDPLYDEAAFSKVIKPMNSPDHEKLIRMLRNLNDMSLDYNEVFDTYFDEENYLTWMAVNVLFGNEDTLTHNMLLYSPRNSEKWYFLPWDYDEAMAYNEPEEWGFRPYQQFGVHYFWSVPLHQRYFRKAGSVDKLRAKMDELMATVFTRENFDALNRGYLAVLDEHLTRQPDVRMQVETYAQDGKSLWENREISLSAAEVYRQIYTERINLRYQAVLNNRRRYDVTLEFPVAFFVQEPVPSGDGWLLSWDAGFDHQRELISYEVILSSGYERTAVAGTGTSDYVQTGIFFRESDLRVNSVVIPELPPGPVFYRVLATDSEGHTQYPRNIAIVPRNDGSGDARYYHGIGYLYHE